MSLDPVVQWPRVRRMFGAAFSSSLHYAIASVDEDGMPHVCPIGSVLLTTPGRGAFFQRFSTGLPRRLEHLDAIAILAVNSSRLFWFRSLLAGRFATPPGLRLQARVLGPPRRPKEEEVARFRKRVAIFKRLRGHDMLWGEMGVVRDFEVEAMHPVRLGAMTRGHWDGEV